MLLLSIEGHLARAEECVRLANMVTDESIRQSLIDMWLESTKLADRMARQYDERLPGGWGVVH